MDSWTQLSDFTHSLTPSPTHTPKSARGTGNSGEMGVLCPCWDPVPLLCCSFINVLALEGTGQRVHGVSVYHLLQLHVTYNYHYKNIKKKISNGKPENTRHLGVYVKSSGKLLRNFKQQ